MSPCDHPLGGHHHSRTGCDSRRNCALSDLVFGGPIHNCAGHHRLLADRIVMMSPLASSKLFQSKLSRRLASSSTDSSTSTCRPSSLKGVEPSNQKAAVLMCGRDSSAGSLARKVLTSM